MYSELFRYAQIRFLVLVLEVLYELSGSLPSMRTGILFVLVHLCIGLLAFLFFKARIPSKVAWTSCRNNTSVSFANEKYWFCVSTFLVSKDGHSVSSLILEAIQHLVKSVLGKLLKEPFDVWARKPTIRIEAEGGVLDDNWLLDLSEGFLNLFSANLLGITLEFWHFGHKSLQSTLTESHSKMP